MDRQSLPCVDLFFFFFLLSTLLQQSGHTIFQILFRAINLKEKNVLHTEKW